MSRNYFSRALVACFDDAADAAAADAAKADADKAAADAAAAANDNKTFTQDQMNKILADDRRKHKATLEATEKTYKDLLDTSKTLTEKERSTLEENLRTVQGQLYSAEERAAKEKKALETEYTGKLSATEKKAVEWETRFKQSTVTRELQDAAVTAGAFSAQQIVTILRGQTKLVEDVDSKSGKSLGTYRVMVEIAGTDPATGEAVMTSKTPTEAMKWMKENPEEFGNLFRANVVSGIGSNSSSGIPQGAGGKPDLAKLAKDPVAFRKAMKENPGALGLGGISLR